MLAVGLPFAPLSSHCIDGALAVVIGKIELKLIDAKRGKRKDAN